jgi:hypothetical protein
MTYNVKCRVLYIQEEQELICKTSIDCMKIRMDQWEWKRVMVECVEKGSHCG